jgi:hypothetical protein
MEKWPSTRGLRLAVMHRLAVHNVKMANCACLAQCAVQRGGDNVSHWFYKSCEFLQREIDFVWGCRVRFSP